MVAVANSIGDKHVTWPNKLGDKDHFRIEFNGMTYLIRCTPKHQELDNSDKKTLLNVLAHMSVFGERGLKSE